MYKIKKCKLYVKFKNEVENIKIITIFAQNLITRI